MGSGVGAVNAMKGYRNRMCKLLAWGGSLAPSWSRKEGKGTELIKEGRGQIQSKLEPEDLVRIWLLFLMPRNATGEFQMGKGHTRMFSLRGARTPVRT